MIDRCYKILMGIKRKRIQGGRPALGLSRLGNAGPLCLENEGTWTGVYRVRR